MSLYINLFKKIDRLEIKISSIIDQLNRLLTEFYKKTFFNPILEKSIRRLIPINHRFSEHLIYMVCRQHILNPRLLNSFASACT